MLTINPIDKRLVYRTAQQRLRVLQRSVARKKKGSASRRSVIRRLQREHVHIANMRKHFHHTTANMLLQHYGVIKHEDLNIRGLAKSMLAKSMLGASWGMFLTTLTQKAPAYGVQVIAVNPYNTTQMCSGCGTIVPKTLADRVHTCGVCGTVLDRDVNAALNILHAQAA